MTRCFPCKGSCRRSTKSASQATVGGSILRSSVQRTAKMSKLGTLDAALKVVRAVIDEESGARHDQRVHNASGEPNSRGVHV